MTILFKYTKKVEEDGTETMSFNIHPVVYLVLAGIVTGICFYFFAN